jgi:tetratricopeptide (TPR) repeat protein
MADNYVKYAESVNKEIEPLLKKLENAPETVEEGSKVDSKADVQKKIDEKKALANKYFNLAIKNFRELTDEWMAKGGRLYGLTKPEDKKKIEDLKNKTIAYIPWVYDRSGDIDKTIIAFTDFLNKCPNHKSVPNALKRRAFKYIEKGETEKAAKDFDTLSSKFPDKAKEIQPELAKAMYETRKYAKSIEAVNKMFEGDIASISVSNLRWVATNLSDCGGTHPKEGAVLALKAVELLLKRLKKPVISDWVRKARVAELEADATKREKTFKVIKDQMYLLGTTAAFWAEDYKTAVKYLNEILANKTTPYFYLAHFKRAEVYNKLKQYQKALKDYGEISNSLLGDKRAPVSLGYKTQVLVGITYILQGELGKALAGMGGAIMSVMSQDSELAGFNQKEVSKEEKELQSKYIEDALFLSACCQNKLGDKDKADKIVETYRKLYPGGRYKGDLSVLPAPETAIKKVKIIIE